jgi:competence CoiA-like predicted nuclease
MSIYKRCGRCGKRLLSGTTCECLKQRHAEYDKYSRDKKSKAFYNSQEWVRTREEVLEMDEKIDVFIFMTTGEVVIADTVHHITPLKDDWTKRIDKENLMSLNHDTHSLIEKKYKENKQKIMSELYEMLEKYRAEIG